ncbi:MAG TPA: DUF2092 domain-containing protein [Planctomycetota bacterium]|nr:DUF2092 domain-containing protein [Planctomycetota bacterium]
MKIRALIAVSLVTVLAANMRAAENADVKMDPKAEAVLNRCAEFYNGARQMRCELSFRMNVEATGTRREIWAKYDVNIERPNKVSMQLKDGVGATIISNGDKMMTYLPATNRYTSREAPPTLDQFFESDEVGLINRSLGELLFLGRLVKADPKAKLIEGSKEVEYKGLVDFEGGKAHQLKLTRNDIDLNVWIADGAQPFLRRVSPDISASLLNQVEGGKDAKMELKIDYSNWSVEPLPKDAFAFSPPDEAKQVGSLFENEDDDAQNPLVGKALPETKLTMMDGSTVDLNDFKDKNVIVLDFWATWCAPCLHALPLTQGVAKEFAEKGVLFYTVNFNEDAEKVRAFMQKQGFDFRVALDKNGDLAKLFEIRGIPFTIVIGKDGKVLSVHSGMQPDLKEMLTKELEAAVQNGEKPVPASAEEKQEAAK